METKTTSPRQCPHRGDHNVTSSWHVPIMGVPNTGSPWQGPHGGVLRMVSPISHPQCKVPNRGSLWWSPIMISPTTSPVPHPFSRSSLLGMGWVSPLGPHGIPPTWPGVPGSPGAAVPPVGTPGPSIPTPLPPQRSSGEGCLLKPKRTNPCAYTPPSLKGTARGGNGARGAAGGSPRCSR